MQSETESLTTYRLRLPKHDVLAVRDLARRESVRQGADIGWCDLVRSAIQRLLQEHAQAG